MCNSKVTREMLTSADSKQLGFDYQYMCFIRQLLKIHHGEEIGYEYHDDIHTISAKGKTNYIQVKHTTKESSDGSQANLTDLSTDLWKTLSNWSQLIRDPAADRSGFEAQAKFLEKSQFTLWINRKINCSSITTLLSAVGNNSLSPKELSDKLISIRESTKDKALQNYIDEVLLLEGANLLAFFKNINIENSDSQIFDEIRTLIQEKMVPDDYIDDIFSALFLQLKENFFDKVKSKQHQIITYDQWITQYLPIFTQYKHTLLPLREFHPDLPDQLDKQFFVKELEEIGALDPNNGIAELGELTRFRLSIKLQLDDWYNSGRISKLDRDRFHNEAFLNWKRSHQASHRKTKAAISLDLENALTCYDVLMQKNLKLKDTEFGLELSNGEFIELAEEHKIGWRYFWKENYNNAN